MQKGFKGAFDLEGGSIEEYIKIKSRETGADPEKTCGLLTTANMQNVSIVSKTYRDLEVTAIVTGGIEVNGGRAGDPASYYEEDGIFKMLGGTINTILLINCNLPEYTMTRAIMTATEAKTVALQQLMAPSRYSNEIATGSGTDMIAIVSNNISKNILTDSGKHSKLGELIGLCVIEATTKALKNESDLTPTSQMNMLVRLERFGIEENDFWKKSCEIEGENRKNIFFEALREIAKKPVVVGQLAGVLHIMDEISWGLVPKITGKKIAIQMIRNLPELLEMDPAPELEYLLSERDDIINNWTKAMSYIIKILLKNK